MEYYFRAQSQPILYSQWGYIATLTCFVPFSCAHDSYNTQETAEFVDLGHPFLYIHMYI